MSQDSNQLLDISSLNDLTDVKIAIVYTEWNHKIIQEQLKGAIHIASQYDVHITKQIAVPGAVELPFTCKEIVSHFDVDAIIAFGAVIRGDTPHFDYVCKMVSEGIGQLNIIYDIPVIFGVLTVNNELQAWERLGGVHGHKGEEAMITALKMVKVKRDFL